MKNNLSSNLCEMDKQRVATSHPLLVVALLLFNHKKEILLSKRPIDKQYGGLWEFPGGKVEEGETKPFALLREIKEELDINLDINRLSSLISSVKHENIEISLYGYIDIKAELSPIPQEKQEICWINPGEIKNYKMPPLDILLCNTDFENIYNTILNKI